MESIENIGNQKRKTLEMVGQAMQLQFQRIQKQQGAQKAAR